MRENLAQDRLKHGRSGFKRISFYVRHGYSDPDIPEPTTILVLPSGLKSIGDEAFAGINAEGIMIPDQVRSIGSRAFTRCPNLVEIHIPESVVTISQDAFEGVNLSRLTIHGIPGSVAEDFAEKTGIRFQAE